jgi:hypothetical protein
VSRHPVSRHLAESFRKEFSPTPEEEASQFYRRGKRYNAVGGLAGTHAMAFVWQIVVVLPLMIAAFFAELLVIGCVAIVRRTRRNRALAKAS